MSEANGTIMKAENVVKLFPVKKSSLLAALTRKPPDYVHAVDGVSLDVQVGDTIAIVGESGSGKTTLARVMLNLIEPTSGKVIWRGKDVSTLDKNELFQFRKDVQIIFQNPGGALNPRKSIFRILSEPLKLHFNIKSGSELVDRASEALLAVGLNPAIHLDRHPHEFSGGQRQRICIARALSLGAKIIFADEPVSSLDVSIQAQILILMKKLKEEFGLTYIFVTHDLALTRSFASRVYVMYLGEIVESGPVEDIFMEPLHTYTKLLLASTPVPNPKRARSRETIIPVGEIPSPINPPPGCRFHTRCALAKAICKTAKPVVKTVGNRSFACHLVN